MHERIRAALQAEKNVSWHPLL